RRTASSNARLASSTISHASGQLPRPGLTCSPMYRAMSRHIVRSAASRVVVLTADHVQVFGVVLVGIHADPRGDRDPVLEREGLGDRRRRRFDPPLVPAPLLEL